MRVYVCVNRGLGLAIMNGRFHDEEKEMKIELFTNRKFALSNYRIKNREAIKDYINKDADHKHQVMVMLFDIPLNKLTYISGDILDSRITEYDNTYNAVYNTILTELKMSKFIKAESKHFYIRNGRLSDRRTNTI